MKVPRTPSKIAPSAPTTTWRWCPRVRPGRSSLNPFLTELWPSVAQTDLRLPSVALSPTPMASRAQSSFKNVTVTGSSRYVVNFYVKFSLWRSNYFQRRVVTTFYNRLRPSWILIFVLTCFQTIVESCQQGTCRYPHDECVDPRGQRRQGQERTSWPAWGIQAQTVPECEPTHEY